VRGRHVAPGAVGGRARPTALWEVAPSEPCLPFAGPIPTRTIGDSGRLGPTHALHSDPIVAAWTPPRDHSIWSAEVRSGISCIVHGNAGWCHGLRLRRERGAPPGDKSRVCWNGLRVRAGVHYGCGDIKLDPVAQGYDYCPGGRPLGVINSLTEGNVCRVLISQRVSQRGTEMSPGRCLFYNTSLLVHIDTPPDRRPGSMPKHQIPYHNLSNG